MTGDGSRTSPRLRLEEVFTGLGAAPVAHVGWTRPTNHDDEPVTVGGTGTIGRESGHIPEALLPGTLTRAVADALVAITVADMTLPDRPLFYLNAAFEELTGYAASAVLVWNLRVDGSSFWNEFHLSPVRNAHGRLTHYVGYQLDITDRVEREDQLHCLAHQDPATGLPNEAAARRHRDELDNAGTGYSIVSVFSDRFGDQDTLDNSDQRVVTILAAHRLREVAPHAYLARSDTHTLQLIGDVPDLAVLQEALQRPVDTGVDAVDLAATVLPSADQSRTGRRI